MRTKTLLLSAAALAAGLITSQAQSNVYSVNIVGYVNLTTPAGQFALLANPLDNGTNDLKSLDQGLPNKSLVEIWNGSGFTGSQKVAGTWGTDLMIPPGTGFFIQTPTATTNVFVGSTPTTNNLTLPGGVFSLVGSPIPLAGTLTNSGPNTLNLGGVLPNKTLVEVWNGTGFTGSQKVAGSWGSNLSIGVGQGFFVSPGGTNAVVWSQNLQ